MNCQKFIQVHSTLPDPEQLLEQTLIDSYSVVKSFGSSTALLGICVSSFLYTLSIGDSGLIVFRKRGNVWTTAFRSSIQQHCFNCPYQLTNLPKQKDHAKLVARGHEKLVNLLGRNYSRTKDSPLDANSEMVPIKEDDIIVAGTDGVFDNLYDSDIAAILDSVIDVNSERKCQRIAKTLVHQAIKNGWSPVFKSPCSKNANKAGKKFIGGKLDDTTVIVSVARRANLSK